MNKQTLLEMVKNILVENNRELAFKTIFELIDEIKDLPENYFDDDIYDEKSWNNQKQDVLDTLYGLGLIGGDVDSILDAAEMLKYLGKEEIMQTIKDAESFDSEGPVTDEELNQYMADLKNGIVDFKKYGINDPLDIEDNYHNLGLRQSDFF